MDLGKYNNMVKDFQNLMSCIKCHEDSTNISVIIETLKTIIDICINEVDGKDAFREEGGLDFLIELVSTTDSTTLLEHLLKTLAFVIDENVHSQMHLTKKEYFLILQAIIQKPTFPPAILKHSLLLTSSILFQNSPAQNLMSDIRFLQDIIKLFEQNASFYICRNFSNPVLTDSSVDILISANSVLCFAVNNPQNERNQESCSVLFPILLKLFESSSDLALSGSLSSFLSLCVASNVKSQQKFADADGLLIIKRSFQKYYDLALLDVTEFHSVVSKCTVQSLINLIGVITAVASENDKNAEVLGKLGVLTLMIKLLINGYLDDQLKTRLILALAYCIDAHSSCKSYVLQFENFHDFLKGCFQNSNPELVAAAKYLLQVFLNGNDNMSESDSNQHEQVFPSVSEKGSVSNFPINKLPNKKSVVCGSVKSITFSKECRHSPLKKNLLSNTIDYHDFIQPFQNAKHSGPFDYSASKQHENICGNKKDMQNLEQNAHSFHPLPPKTWFKHDNAEYYREFHTAHTPSVKSYQNLKKENVLLINSNSNLCSLPKFETEKFDCKRAEQTSVVLPESDGSSRSNQDHRREFNISSPKQTKYSSVSHCNHSNSLRDFKKCNSFFTEIPHFNQKNKSIMSLKNYPLKLKSMENISEFKENSVISMRNATKYKTKSYYDFPVSLKNSCCKNAPVDKLKNCSCISQEAVLPVKSLHDPVQFPTSDNFLKTFNSGLQTRNSETKDFTSRHKKRKRNKNTSVATLVETNLNSSNLNMDCDQVFGNNVQVIALPGVTCEQHKLIASFEYLKVKPLKDAILTMD